MRETTPENGPTEEPIYFGASIYTATELARVAVRAATEDIARKEVELFYEANRKKFLFEPYEPDNQANQYWPLSIEDSERQDKVQQPNDPVILYELKKID